MLVSASTIWATCRAPSRCTRARLPADPADTDLYLNLGLRPGAWPQPGRRKAFSAITASWRPISRWAGIIWRASCATPALLTTPSRSAAARSCACRNSRCCGTRLGTILVELQRFRAGRRLSTARRCRFDPASRAPGNNLGYGLHHTGPLAEAMDAYESPALPQEPRATGSRRCTRRRCACPPWGDPQTGFRRLRDPPRPPPASRLRCSTASMRRCGRARIFFRPLPLLVIGEQGRRRGDVRQHAWRPPEGRSA